MDKKQSSDHVNKERAAGTGVTSFKLRDSSATPPIAKGGENSDSGNRNKRS